MYGYTFPRRPEPGSQRVMVCESQVQRYLALFPRLDREQVMHALKLPGATRVQIEAELQRLARVA